MLDDSVRTMVFRIAGFVLLAAATDCAITPPPTPVVTPPPVPAVTAPPAPEASALGRLAASMSPGQWAPFTMGGLSGALLYADGPSVHTLLGYAARGHWDGVHKKISFTGVSHTGGQYIANAGALLTWDDATNQWTRESYKWNVYDPGHSYYHNTLNQSTGDLYFRQFNSATVYRHAYGSKGQAAWERDQVANVPNQARQVAGGLEWFPELNGGAGGLVFIDTLGASWSNAALTSWTSTSNLTSGRYHNWIASAGGFVYWGGGGGLTVMYRLSPTGSAVKLPNTPIPAGVNEDAGIVLTHPNSKNLLLFGTAAGGPVYRFDGATWTSAATHQIGGQLWVGFTVPDYGVIVFVRHENVGTGAGSAIVFKP